MAVSESFLNVLYGAIGGAVTTFVALRTRLAMMQRDDDEIKEQEERHHKEVCDRLAAIDRRQRVTIEIVADVANKGGVNRRLGDGLVRFLAEGEGARHSD